MSAGIVVGPADGRNRPDQVIAAKPGPAHDGPVTRHIVFVVYPGIVALDLVGPHEVFTAAAEVARRTGREPDAYRVEVVAPEAGIVPVDARARLRRRPGARTRCAARSTRS